MDIERLRELIRLLEESELAELEIEEEGRRIALRKPGHAPGGAPQYVMMGGMPAGPPSELGAASAPAAEPKEASVSEEEEPGEVITAPMVGVFYRAPSPNEPAYVNPGDTVEAGATVCIVEAMKLMNEVSAKKRAKITRVLAENGEPVEYGQPLFAIQALD